eukprot:EG_transcript_21552
MANNTRIQREYAERTEVPGLAASHPAPLALADAPESDMTTAAETTPAGGLRCVQLRGPKPFNARANNQRLQMEFGGDVPAALWNEPAEYDHAATDVVTPSKAIPGTAVSRDPLEEGEEEIDVSPIRTGMEEVDVAGVQLNVGE